MSIVLLGSTSGSITLSEPAVAGTNTLSLPAVTATLATEVNGVLYPLTSGTAVASTSGTSVAFTSIPSWVKRITVMLSGVSTSGTSNIIVQLGTGGTPTYTTSGYASTCSDTTVGTATSGFLITNSVAAANIRSGATVISNLTSNTWVNSGVISRTESAVGGFCSGSVGLAAALTAVRVTTINGTDTFDAGSINILYE